MVDLPGHGRAVLNRIRHEDGSEYAEMRVRVALVDIEPVARRQLLTILTDVRELVTRAAIAGRPAPRPRKAA